jgi:hypothetical protein
MVVVGVVLVMEAEVECIRHRQIEMVHRLRQAQAAAVVVLVVVVGFHQVLTVQCPIPQNLCKVMTTITHQDPHHHHHCIQDTHTHHTLHHTTTTATAITITTITAMGCLHHHLHHLGATEVDHPQVGTHRLIIIIIFITMVVVPDTPTPIHVLGMRTLTPHRILRTTTTTTTTHLYPLMQQSSAAEAAAEAGVKVVQKHPIR